MLTFFNSPRVTIITNILSGNKTQLDGEKWCPFIRRDVASGNDAMPYVVLRDFLVILQPGAQWFAFRRDQYFVFFVFLFFVIFPANF